MNQTTNTNTAMASAPFQIKIYVECIAEDEPNAAINIEEELGEKKFKIDNQEFVPRSEDWENYFYIVVRIDIPRIAERKGNATLLQELKTKIEPFFTDLLRRANLSAFDLFFGWDDFELNDLPVQLFVSDPITASPDSEGMELVVDDESSSSDESTFSQRLRSEFTSDNREDLPVPPPGSPPREGTSRTSPPAVRRPRGQFPMVGDIWVPKDNASVQYIVETVTHFGQFYRTVGFRRLTIPYRLEVVGDRLGKSLTMDEFLDSYFFYKRGIRVGDEVVSEERPEIKGTVDSIDFDRDNFVKIKLENDDGWRYAWKFRLKRRNVGEEIENVAIARDEFRAKLGVEYTLEQFREKDFPKASDRLIFKRYRYDYEKKKWVSTKMVITEDGTDRIMSEVDCDIVPLEGDEWGLEMPVKIKVKNTKPPKKKKEVEKGEEVVWETKVDGELQLYCAKDLKGWLNANQFGNYALYSQDEGHVFTSEQKNDKSPRDRESKIVSVQYLSEEEKDELEKKYKENAEKNKKRADERKKKRGPQDDETEERRKKLQRSASIAPPTNERVIERKKKALLEAEKGVWKSDKQLSEGIGDQFVDQQDRNGWQTFQNTLAGNERILEQYPKDLERLGQKEWLVEWRTKYGERKQKWIEEENRKVTVDVYVDNAGIIEKQVYDELVESLFDKIKADVEKKKDLKDNIRTRIGRMEVSYKVEIDSDVVSNERNNRAFGLVFTLPTSEDDAERRWVRYYTIANYIDYKIKELKNICLEASWSRLGEDYNGLAAVTIRTPDSSGSSGKRCVMQFQGIEKISQLKF